MDHSGHRERLRQRYRKEGLSGFAPHETLELLLTYAIPRVNTNDTAHELMDRFGSLSGVLEASQAELEQVKGVGDQASTLLTMLVPILKMYEQEKLLPRKRLTTYRELADYCRTLYLGARNEQFYVICLDAKLNLLSVKMIAQDTPNHVHIEPRLVVEELLRYNATGAVISHNHPSGSPLPSQEDVAVTRELEALLDGMGIRLYDHILIAGNRDYSFFANHWMKNAPDSVLSEEEEDREAAEKPLRVLPAKKKEKR